MTMRGEDAGQRLYRNVLYDVFMFAVDACPDDGQRLPWHVLQFRSFEDAAADECRPLFPGGPVMILTSLAEIGSGRVRLAKAVLRRQGQ